MPHRDRRAGNHRRDRDTKATEVVLESDAGGKQKASREETRNATSEADLNAIHKMDRPVQGRQRSHRHAAVLTYGEMKYRGHRQPQ
jgi:hypothetical protein